MNVQRCDKSYRRDADFIVEEQEFEKALEAAFEAHRQGYTAYAKQLLDEANSLRRRRKSYRDCDSDSNTCSSTSSRNNSCTNINMPLEDATDCAAEARIRHQARMDMPTAETKARTFKDTASPPPKNAYSKEELELVLKIAECNNYYEVLSISQHAEQSEIRKAYRRLALQLHPDKNLAPGATDAFKSVSNAASILLDNEKRQEYDDLLLARQLELSDMNVQTHFDNANMAADEIYRMFFGHDYESDERPAAPQQMPTRRRQYQPANQRQPQTIYQPSLTLAFALMLMLIGATSMYFSSDDVYSLYRTHKYPVQRTTKHLSVPYWVQHTFEKDHKGSLARLEHLVEEDFIKTMKRACFQERSYRESMMARARSIGSRAQFAQAQGLRTPSCDNLSRIGIKRYSLF